jgi:hypothetical protein
VEQLLQLRALRDSMKIKKNKERRFMAAAAGLYFGHP